MQWHRSRWSPRRWGGRRVAGAQGKEKGRAWQPLARGIQVRKLIAQQVRKYLWS